MFMKGSLPEPGPRVQYLKPTLWVLMPILTTLSPVRIWKPDPLPSAWAVTCGVPSQFSWIYSMQLPDEAISYQYQSLLVPNVEEWTPAAESRSQHFLHPSKLKELEPRLMQVRSKIATERDLKTPP